MTEAVTPAAERPVAPLAFVDTETDGVHPGRRPWEIAIIRREPGGRETEWQAFVDIDLSTANPFGLRVGRFYDRHPLGRELSSGVISQSERGPEWVGTAHATRRVAQLTHGCHIVGAVPNFDAEVLDRLLREHGLVPAWHHRLRCVETLTAGHLRREVGGLTRCAEALGIEVPEDGEHTALGDARTAQRVYDAVMASPVPGIEIDDVIEAVLNLTTEQSNQIDDIAPGLYTAVMCMAHTQLARDLAGDVR
jgi:hypothetical protein